MLVIFLGTSGSIPTSKRNLASVVLKYDSEILMFDCGEGTQRQAVSAGLSLARKIKIFISHMHGDHVLGREAAARAILGEVVGREDQGVPFPSRVVGW